MIITSLRVAGFGQLVDRSFDFGPGLNVVVGSNESGKSTLAGAIVALLYGADRRKEAWRPWTGGAFAATLIYELDCGDSIEVQRDFERDAKGLRVYDRSGNELSAKLGGQRVTPGDAHLGLPLDVFLSAACVKQETLAIAGGKDAGPLATHLARALDGGPRDDAALGAIGRLDEALRVHVGTERARKNAPLRALRTLADDQRAIAGAARARLATLDKLRDAAQAATRESERLSAAAAETERRFRSARAGSIAKRLANLHAFRAEFAELNAALEGFADVARFRPGSEAAIEQAYLRWESAEVTAAAAQAEAQAVALSDADRTAFERELAEIGAIDDGTFAALNAANDRAVKAREAATAAAREAAATPAGRPVQTNGFALAAAIFVLCIACGFAIAHDWRWAGCAGAAAGVGLFLQAVRRHADQRRVREAAAQQRSADIALDAENRAAREVERGLAPLGFAAFAPLAKRRVELAALGARARTAQRAREHAQSARSAAQAAAARYDVLVDAVLPASHDDRETRRAAVTRHAARRRERDGIAAHLHALELQRSTILGDDDEYTLERELAALQRAGVDAADGGAGALHELEDERASISARLSASRETAARLWGEIGVLQAHIDDLAELDEQLARTQRQIDRIEAFERAVQLARSVLAERTREAHIGFARRIESYAAQTLGTITANRYTEVFVDPATLAVRVRIPETNEIAAIDTLSTGTRDQMYLVVRFAMARLFGEGLERAPLLLDEPFAYWDNERIERCLPVLEAAAANGQAIVFTSSNEFALAATRRGARRLDLRRTSPPPRAPSMHGVIH